MVTFSKSVYGYTLAAAECCNSCTHNIDDSLPTLGVTVILTSTFDTMLRNASKLKALMQIQMAPDVQLISTYSNKPTCVPYI